MRLLETFKKFQAGQITLEDAAAIYGLTPTDFRFRLTRYGESFSTILEVLDAIGEGQISRDEAASALKKDVRAVNRLQTSFKVARPPKPYLVSRALSGVKWDLHKKVAIDFIAGDIDDLDKAAAKAQVVTRQFRRIVADLLMQHYDMPYKDLKLTSQSNRERIAEDIAKHENLTEEKKQRTLARIADGTLSLEKLATKNIIEKQISKLDRKPDHV